MNFGPKLLFLGMFVLEVQNTVVVFEINTFKVVYFQNFAKKIKTSKFRINTAFFGYVYQNFRTPLSYLKPTLLILPICKISQKKIKYLNLVQNVLYLCIFWLDIEKNYCYISNHFLEIWVFAKIHQRRECPMLGAGLPYLDISMLEI